MTGIKWKQWKKAEEYVDNLLKYIENERKGKKIMQVQYETVIKP